MRRAFCAGPLFGAWVDALWLRPRPFGQSAVLAPQSPPPRRPARSDGGPARMSSGMRECSSHVSPGPAKTSRPTAMLNRRTTTPAAGTSVDAFAALHRVGVGPRRAVARTWRLLPRRRCDARPPSWRRPSTGPSRQWRPLLLGRAGGGGARHGSASPIARGRHADSRGRRGTAVGRAPMLPRGSWKGNWTVSICRRFGACPVGSAPDSLDHSPVTDRFSCRRMSPETKYDFERFHYFHHLCRQTHAG